MANGRLWVLNSSLLIKGLSFQKDLYLELANHPTDPKLIWKAVLGKLQLQVNKSSFETWLVSTAGHLLEDTSLTVSVPNNFVAEMLDQRMYSIISSAVQQVLKKDIDVNFIVVDPSMNAADPIATHARPNTAISSTVKPLAFYNKGWRTFKNFVVGDSNKLAHAASLSVAENPGTAYNPLFIYSGVGLGKTHLLTAIANSLNASSFKAIYVTAEEFTNEYINSIRFAKTDHFRNKYRHIDALLIDDIQFIAGKEQTQEGFFHTFNSLVTEGKQIVISSDRPAKEIEHLHERLVSRMLGGLIVDIQQPDLETKVAILKSKSESLNANISGEILFYFAEQVTSNIRALEGCVNKIKAYVQLTNLSPDMNLAKSIVSELSPSLKNLTATKTSVIDAVSHHFGLSAQLVLGNSRNSRCVTARQIYMYILREDLNLSLAEICQTTGKKHSSVIYSCNQIINNLQSNSLLLDDLTKIRSTIERKLNN